MSNTDIFIFAAETSADRHGASLIRALKSARPGLKIAACAGHYMRQEEIEIAFREEDFEAFGFIDVLRRLPTIFRNFFKIKKFVLDARPKVAIFIDSPDLTLRLEKSLKKGGFQGKIVHYVSPTVWAWRRSRIQVMEESLDLLLTIFPFEKKYYDEASFRVEYVGNPLIAYLKDHKYKQLDFNLGLFPGSREKEIERNLPLMLMAVKGLLEEFPLKAAVSLSNERFRPLIERIFDDHALYLPLVPGEENYNLMRNLKLAFATSGTITLELALHNIPSVVTYAIKKLDLFIARNILKINLKHYCIVNILAERELFYELYGPNFTLENLTLYAKKILKSPAFDGQRVIKNILTGKEASLEAARHIISFFD